MIPNNTQCKKQCDRKKRTQYAFKSFVFHFLIVLFIYTLPSSLLDLKCSTTTDRIPLCLFPSTRTSSISSLPGSYFSIRSVAYAPPTQFISVSYVPCSIAFSISVFSARNKFRFPFGYSFISPPTHVTRTAQFRVVIYVERSHTSFVQMVLTRKKTEIPFFSTFLYRLRTSTFFTAFAQASFLPNKIGKSALSLGMILAGDKFRAPLYGSIRYLGFGQFFSAPLEIIVL